MDRKILMSPESAQASDIFDKFCTAATLKGILFQYRQLCNVLKLKPTHFTEFYPRIRQKLCSWRAQGLWSKFEKRASHKCYARGQACAGSRVLIIGGGPCGLRTAIEAQLLGAKVVLIEKRDRFSRNNVLHLWPFVITDLKALGAKKFYGKFCAGSIDHISIRQLQCILLKVALLLGVEVHEGVGFESLEEPTDDEGWRAITSPGDHPVSQYNFNCLIGADGRRNTLEGFKRKALRAKLAIAITANYINKRTEAEARVKEISGVSYIFNQKFFQDLNEATGIDLENIVYYKDETHYFVMTAKKQSLLCKGVLLNDHADTAKLLSHENISTEALMIYAMEAAGFSTDYQLPNLEFAVNHYGQPDVAMFDFTAMYAAENACRVVQRHGHKLLMALVGDSLLEPFWPTGSGCARGFLSSFDACWMLRCLATGTRTTLEVLAERESMYRLLGQTTPENLNKEHAGYTLDPHTRYPNLNQKVVMPFQVKSLYDTDEQFPEGFEGTPEQDLDGTGRLTKKRRRDAVVPVDTLLAWLRDQVQGYSLEVNSITETFIRGDILCAIIHRFRPDLMEYPPISEENVDPLEIVAQRNEIAFEFLHKEYGIAPVMSGIESAQVNMSDFHTLVAYLSQLYDAFKGEIPQVKYPRVYGADETDEPSYQSSLSHIKYGRPSLVVKPGPSVRISRRSRVSTSREGEHSDRKHRKSRRPDERARISMEEREKREEEIEKNRLERQKRRMQERVLQTERFVKSMRLLQMNDRSQDKCNDGNDAFEDYTFHLYRQMAPDFDERCKSLEQKLFFSGREIRTTVGGHQESEKVRVTGLAKNLEEKLRGGRTSDKKPKDLIRAIGKIEKSDWNVQLIEKKIAESKTHEQCKKEHDKVPKWSREAYDDKREAMKRKMEGVSEKRLNEKEKLFEETVKRLGNKLKEGNTLDIGQRGCNKVSQMAEQLSHKYAPTKEVETTPKHVNTRPVFELPTKGGSELCHFCNQRVYVVERMTTEGKYFHRNCFRCEYCNTSLRLGNYVFDREGRYGDRFYCVPHHQTVKMYGWKKFDQQNASFKTEQEKIVSEGRSSFLTPTPHQILSEMDDRGTTPERVEFENSVDFASEEELLSEMDEDEWTDRNFGASKVETNESNTSDEASDLSEDDEVTPDGNIAKQHHQQQAQGTTVAVQEKADSTDSDTEIASGSASEGSEEDSSNDPDEDNDGCEDEDEEEECEGSTTEVETDSEFAEDPPQLDPGKIPTIVVEEHELHTIKSVEHGHRVPSAKTHGNKSTRPKHEEVYGALPVVEPVLRSDLPRGRALPKVYSAPKKWEPLANLNSQPDVKYSSELKKKYLEGPPVQAKTSASKKAPDPATQNKFSSLLDMISEKQKLLQPASEPSPTMQAFLEGAEKLKAKTSLATLRGLNCSVPEEKKPLTSTPSPSDLLMWSKSEEETISMNIKNLEKSMELSSPCLEGVEKSDTEKEMYTLALGSEGKSPVQFGDVTDLNVESMLISSDTLSSQSQSKTESQCTIKEAENPTSRLYFPDETHSETGSEGESLSCGEMVSDTDEAEVEEPPVAHYPPRVEIEDEFGVSLSLDEDKVVERKHQASSKVGNHQLAHVCVVSSSDSKESLNSAAFLETDLSEWSRDAGKQIPGQTVAEKVSPARACPTTETNLAKTPLALHLDSLDFADMELDSNQSPVPELPKSEARQNSVTRHVDGVPNDLNHVKSESAHVSSTHGVKQVQDPKVKPVDASTKSVLVEAVNASVVLPASVTDDKGKFAMLDRVVPFSKARDSLDYRKMKNTAHPSKSLTARTYKHFFSIKSPTVQNVENISSSSQEFVTTTKKDESSLALDIDDNANKDSRSPVTVRRLEQINQERSKQNDLIKSMVLDRIRRSPEKNKRGSRGSLTIGSSEFLETSGKSSAQNFESGSESSINSGVEELACRKSGSACDRITLTSTNGARNDMNNTSSKISPPQQILPLDDDDANDSFDMAIRSLRNAQRGRPYFDSPTENVDSLNHNSTPVRFPSVQTPSAPLKNLDLNVDETGNQVSPSFYRSMPDLSNSEQELEINAKPKVSKVSSFISPGEKTRISPRSVSLLSHERAREEARERARLKTDEELALHHTGNDDTLKDNTYGRKLSFTKDEVFNPDAAITTRVYSRADQQISGASPVASQHSYTIGELDNSDNVAASIRQNVDFPMKKNPFLVPAKDEQGLGKPTSSSEPNDFVQLNLRVSPKAMKSNESNPYNQLNTPNKFPTFFSTPNASISVWSKEFLDIEKKSPQKAHCRSHTVTGIQLESSPITPGTVGYHHDASASTKATKGPKDGMSRIQGHNATNALAYSPMYDYDTNPSASRTPNKAKARSTETLLDSTKFTLPPEGEPFRGVSTPDVTRDFLPSESKPKRSKDRTRRRSLIQAVSDFFTTKSPSAAKSPTSTDPDKSSSTSSPSTSTPRDNKFSIFKLTPKLLQKERMSSSPDSRQVSEKGKPTKNPRASFMSYLSQPEILVHRFSNSPTIPSTSPGTSALRLSYSQDPSLPVRQGKSKHEVTSTEKQRKLDLMEIQLQMESVETEQRQLECRGVSIERMLRGEEDDEGLDHAVLMEEWFTLVREKIRLSRYEKELLVRARELELDFKEESLEDELETSLLVNDCAKSPEDKTREADLFEELNEVKRQREALLAGFHEEMLKYEREDAELEARCSTLSPRESNV